MNINPEVFKSPKCDEAVSRLSLTDGWDFLSAWIEYQIQAKTNDLVDADANNPAKMALCQGQVKGLRSVLDWVGERHKRQMRGED